MKKIVGLFFLKENASIKKLSSQNEMKTEKSILYQIYVEMIE